MEATKQDLIARTPEAATWIKDEQINWSRGEVFGRFGSAVIWIDDPAAHGEPIGGKILNL